MLPPGCGDGRCGWSQKGTNINRDCDGVVLSLARDYCVLADLAEYDKSVTTELFDELLDFMTDPEIYYFSIPRFLEDYPRLVGCGA